MTEAEQITLEMMAAYSTNPRFFLDKVEETKPIIFDPPRTEQGTINETHHKKSMGAMGGLRLPPPHRIDFTNFCQKSTRLQHNTAEMP
jgi:hypothetical protein